MSKVHHCATPLVLSVIGLLLIAYCVLIIIGNLLVCVAVFRYKKLRKKSNFLLVSLSICDLCIGVIVLPVYIATTILCHWPADSICFLYMALDISLCTASLLHICAIAVDRYIAIAHPLRHRTCMTSSKVALLIAVVWMTSALLFCYTAYKSYRVAMKLAKAQFQHAGECVNPWTKGEFLVVSVLVFHIPLVAIVALYLRIVFIIRRTFSSIRSMSKENKDPHETERNGLRSSMTGADPRLGTLQKERKSLRIIGLVLAAFMICWLPFFVVTAVEFYTENTIWWLNMLVTVMGYLNSGINPIIYASSKDFRVAFVSMMKCERSVSEAGSHPNPVRLSCDTTVTAIRSLSRESRI